MNFSMWSQTTATGGLSWELSFKTGSIVLKVLSQNTSQENTYLCP